MFIDVTRDDLDRAQKAHEQITFHNWKNPVALAVQRTFGDEYAVVTPTKLYLSQGRAIELSLAAKNYLTEWRAGRRLPVQRLSLCTEEWR